MPHTVAIESKARADLRRNAAWMARRFSAARADRWLARAERTIFGLADRPEQHPQADEAADLGRPLRCKLLGRRRQVFRILFTIVGVTVVVHRVRHAAQDRLTADDL